MSSFLVIIIYFFSQTNLLNISSGTSNEQIDYDYIDFKYLEANSLNINFRRDKEWKSSPCLDEIKSLEEQLSHDTELTFAEKSVIYKYKKLHVNTVQKNLRF